MKKGYGLTHLHTMLSNCVTNIDSVTSYEDYINYICINKEELGINSIVFTEHGSVFEWYKKKEYLEKHGLKYVHGMEAYVTETLIEKKRDNFHVCLYAKNFEGFKELNKLSSKSFDRSEFDGHFYYNPRITFEELINTSDNILMTTACLGGIMSKGSEELQKRFLDFAIENKDRVWFEVQHHNVEDQAKYNKKLYELSLEHGLNLIVGTDTHALNDIHLKGRSVLQKAKNVFFENEDGWDLKVKSYDELIEAFDEQGVLPRDVVEQALENTNVLVDMVEEFKVDKSYKYPKLYDNPKEVLMEKIKKGCIDRGVYKYDDFKSTYIPRIEEEMKTYEHNGAFDFLLLDEDIKTYARSNGRFPGPSRGSVSGSIIAYLIGMTDVDSIRHNMNFQRFMNTERVSLADVDTDWSPKDREFVKDYIYSKEGLYCCDIITFNTVATKGSVRDVCRALFSKEVPKELLEKRDAQCEHYGRPLDETSMEIEKYSKSYMDISDEISKAIDNSKEDLMRDKYPDVFEIVDIINGTIVSCGTHPCGLVVSPITLDDNMGLCSTSKCTRPVSQVSMKAIDAQNYVKLDLLCLDNVGIINETCEMAGIERLIPENVPDEEDVWKSMATDNVLIFQWESDSAQDFLSKLLSEETIKKIAEVNPNFKYKDLASMGNGAIRPAGASYRKELSMGIFRDNGHKALNDFLAPTMGYLVYQCQIIEFLNKFCGFTMGEADIVRRGFAKKSGTDIFIPVIKDGGWLLNKGEELTEEIKKTRRYIPGFIATMKKEHGVKKEEAEKLIVNFLQVIEDASDYLFSINHAEPYTYIGYMCAWLKKHYPLEFLTVGLNYNQDNQEKSSKIIECALKRGIKILPPKFGYSRAEYMCDKETNSIYKGISSIKFLNACVAEELYELRNEKFENFSSLIRHMMINTSIDFRQLKILTKLNYFSDFGKNKKLLTIVEEYEKKLKNKNLKEATVTKRMADMIEFENSVENKAFDIKSQLQFELEYIGYCTTTKSQLPENVYYVMDINNKSTTKVSLYTIKDGRAIEVMVYKADMKTNIPFGIGNIIQMTRKKEKVVGGENKTYLTGWNLVM